MKKLLLKTYIDPATSQRSVRLFLHPPQIIHWLSFSFADVHEIPSTALLFQVQFIRGHELVTLAWLLRGEEWADTFTIRASLFQTRCMSEMFFTCKIFWLVFLDRMNDLISICYRESPNTIYHYNLITILFYQHPLKCLQYICLYVIEKMSSWMLLKHTLKI